MTGNMTSPSCPPGRQRVQLGLAAGALIVVLALVVVVVKGRPAPPMPALFVQIGREHPKERPALEAVWLTCQRHGDLQQTLAKDPERLLQWAINDARSGSGYSPPELGPYAADLVALAPLMEPPLPPFFVQASSGDPKARAALSALWRTYEGHGDLQGAFAGNAKGLLRWAINDAKSGSGYSPKELGPQAAALIALEPKLADPVPLYLVRVSQGDAEGEAAVQALWRTVQDHGDLQHDYANDPVGLLQWAAKDAENGSGYSRSELGPHAAALISLGRKLRNTLPEALEREAQKGADVRAAMRALWSVYLNRPDLQASLKHDPSRLVAWGVDDAKQGSRYSPADLGPYAKILGSLQPVR